MAARSIIRGACVLVFASGLCTAGPAGAQAVAASAHIAASSGATEAAAPDMALPDDLGAPLPGAAPEPAAVPARVLSVNTPIWMIAANPQGRAVLEQQLPGLCERPEFMMFKGMSLAKLAVLSRGQISLADLTRLEADLTKVSLSDGPIVRQHSMFTRSSRSVGRLSRTLYQHMVSVIAAL